MEDYFLKNDILELYFYLDRIMKLCDRRYMKIQDV